MISEELEKYLNRYISFTVDKQAYSHAPNIVGKDTRDQLNRYEGRLLRNNSAVSHFCLKFYNKYTDEIEGIAITDYEIPYIQNIKIMEN